MDNRSYHKSSLSILLNKSISEQFAMFKKGNKKIDIGAMILSALLVAILLVVFVYVFKAFATSYVSVEINFVKDIASRTRELLSIGYMAVFGITVISGVNSVNRAIFDGQDLLLLTAMPISKVSIYIYKLCLVYLRQIVTVMLTLLPYNFTLAYVVGMPAGFYVASVAMCFVLPLMAMAISAIVALPVYIIKQFVSNKYVLVLILLTVGMAVCFVFYYQFVELFEQLITTGHIRFVFSEKLMSTIAVVTANLYPTIWLVNLTIGHQLLISLLLTLGGIALSLTVAYFMVRNLFARAVVSHALTTRAYFVKNRHSLRQRSIMRSLMKKEFDTVIRTPSYALSYFSVAIIMPLMVFLCMRLGSNLLFNLVYIRANFELAIMLTITFGVLTNTFCGTNISREGNMTYIVKCLPIGYKQIVYSKILFCFCVAGACNIITSIVLCATGFVNVWQSMFVAIVGLIVSFAQISIATRLDLNNPLIRDEQDDIVTESSNIVSWLIMVGLSVAVVFGCIALYFAVVQNILASQGIISTVLDSAVLTPLIIGILAVMLCAGSVVALQYKLKQRFDRYGERTR